MAKSRPRITIPARTWVDLYDASALNGASRIADGTQLLIQVTGEHGCMLVEDDAEPDIEATGRFYLGPKAPPFINDSGNIGAWAWSFSDTYIQVEEN